MIIPEGFIEGNPQAVQIFAHRIDEEGNDSDSFLLGSEIMSLESDGIDVKLYFRNPLTVSKGDEPDQLFVQLELSDLKTKQDDIPMP